MVKGWELEFRGVATIVPKPDTEVPVLLWELDPRDIPALNRYEGFPHLYRQQEIDVVTSDCIVKGMVYLMNRGQISPPSQGYLQTIWDGYKANGMDTSYLVEAAARAYDYASDMNIKYDESLDEAALYISKQEVSKLICAAVISKQNKTRKEKRIFDKIFRYLRRHRRFPLRP